MKTKTEGIIRRIKTAVEDLQAHSYNEFQHKLATYINYDNNLGYTMLDNFFSCVTGISIKQYFNQVKAEKANELLNYYRISPIEIAYQLGFKTEASVKKALKVRDEYPHQAVRFQGKRIVKIV